MAQLKMVQGVIKLFEEFESDLPRSVATAVLGTSFKHMPVDTGHMMRQTRMFERKDGGGWQLVTSTKYAYGQYTKELNHYIVGGAYKSISRSNIGISLDEGRVIKGLSGGAKFKEMYWTKYRRLREAGALTPEAPEWFATAYHEVMKGAWNPIARNAIAELRKKAREGSYYEKAGA